jgi:hypothetical protein
MTKFEYVSVNLITIGNLDKKLNEMGEVGWELVSVIEHAVPPFVQMANYFICVFKREVK